MKNIVAVVGVRPNFMKIAPFISEIAKYPEDFKAKLVHTGQHYDYKMSKVFFEDLDLLKPDYYLGVGSGSHSEQTAKVMIGFEMVLEKEKPDLVVVVGDVNSTLACALTSAKLRIKVAHIEAGLRSFDRDMPEETNRQVTDVLSDYLFTPSQDANENLKREGISSEKIFFVGNIMIDTLMRYRDKAEKNKIKEDLGLIKENYALLTLHRPENVDRKDALTQIFSAIEDLQKRIKIIYPIHPRTKKKIEEFGLKDEVGSMKNLILTPPLSYIEFLRLMLEAKLVLTDSGGIQEETTFLSIPCLTVRNNTERPITVDIGTNIIVGKSPEKIIEEAFHMLNGNLKRGEIPPLWDGKTAKRIVEILIRRR